MCVPSKTLCPAIKDFKWGYLFLYKKKTTGAKRIATVTTKKDIISNYFFFIIEVKLVFLIDFF